MMESIEGESAMTREIWDFRRENNLLLCYFARKIKRTD
jgi:hypothetical protein